jgi:DHA1 family tetracycline resistance protein-like MFS transporter
MAAARKPAISFIFITLVLDILGIGLIIPILPTLIEEMQGKGLANAAYTFGVLAALYSLMQFLFAPMLGSLSDRYGRRPVILISLFGSGIDYFFLAFAPTIGWFFFARMISGITGANFAPATAYIADVSPPEKRAANFGLIGVAFGLGFIIGPAIGGVLGEIDLRLPFIAAGCLTLLNWLYGLFVLPESLKPENRRAFSWKRSNPVGSLLALRRYPMIFGLAGSHFLASLAHQVLPATWVLYTAYRYGWSEKDTGWSLALVGLMSALVQGGLTRVVIPKIGEKKAAALGFSISAICYVLYGLAAQGWMVLIIIVFGSLGGLAGPALQGLISRNVGDNEQGSVQGSLTSLSSIANIIGMITATSLFGFFVGKHAPIILPGAPFFFGAVVIILGLCLAIRSYRKA